MTTSRSLSGGREWLETLLGHFKTHERTCGEYLIIAVSKVGHRDELGDMWVVVCDVMCGHVCHASVNAWGTFGKTERRGKSSLEILDFGREPTGYRVGLYQVGAGDCSTPHLSQWSGIVWVDIRKVLDA